jgi:hypothetical protein
LGAHMSCLSLRSLEVSMSDPWLWPMLGEVLGGTRLAAALKSPGCGAGPNPRSVPQHGQFGGSFPSGQEPGVYCGENSGAPVCCVMIVAVEGSKC